VRGLEFTALNVHADTIFLSSSETLFVLSAPSGTVITQDTAHTTPIRSIHYSPEQQILSTTATGDRFIPIYSYTNQTLARLGSLTCTHDVRNLILHNDTLLAITIDGTLEIFNSYYTGFEPGKKGGMTKPPSAEIQLRGKDRKLEVLDVSPRGREVLVSWVEAGKMGFEVLNLEKVVGKVHLNIETKQAEPSELQVPRSVRPSNIVYETVQ
jgi:WD40 repeat protein